jgi:hypothetical protein
MSSRLSGALIEEHVRFEKKYGHPARLHPDVVALIDKQKKEKDALREEHLERAGGTFTDVQRREWECASYEMRHAHTDEVNELIMRIVCADGETE